MQTTLAGEKLGQIFFAKTRTVIAMASLLYNSIQLADEGIVSGSHVRSVIELIAGLRSNLWTLAYSPTMQVIALVVASLSLTLGLLKVELDRREKRREAQQRAIDEKLARAERKRIALAKQQRRLQTRQWALAQRHQELQEQISAYDMREEMNVLREQIARDLEIDRSNQEAFDQAIRERMRREVDALRRELQTVKTELRILNTQGPSSSLNQASMAQLDIRASAFSDRVDSGHQLTPPA